MLRAPKEEISTLSSTSCRAWIGADPFAVWTQGSPSGEVGSNTENTTVPFSRWRVPPGFANIIVAVVVCDLMPSRKWCTDEVSHCQGYKIRCPVGMMYRPGLLFLKNSILSIGVLLLRWIGPAAAFISCEMKHWEWALYSSILVCLTNSSSLKTFTVSQLCVPLVHTLKS